VRLGINISLTGQSSGFGPASLFAAGQSGVWYDPSDISTLFQTNATPVTAVGQPVGVMLDKSQGLQPGPQLVTNGTFVSNTDGWSTVNGAVIDAVGGKMRVLNNTTSNGNAYQAITTVIGRTYLLTGQISDVTGGIQPRLMAGTGISAGDLVSSQYSGSGTFDVRAVFVATGTTTYINAIMNTTTSGVYASFDNISVQDIPGNHARQSTAGSRPTYQIDGNGKLYLNFDGVDDFTLLDAALNMVSGTFVTGFVETAGQTGPVALFANNASGYVAINGSGAARSIAKNNGGTIIQIDTPGAFPMTAQSPVQINSSSGTLTAYRGSDRTAYTNSVAGAAILSFQVLGAFDALGQIRVNGKFYGLVARTTALSEGEAVNTLSYLTARM